MSDAALLHYESGFPTLLPNATRLAALLRQHGEPSSIRHIGGIIHLAWPIYPGAPCPESTVRNPWLKDTRRVVRVSLN